jgi:hypothetical protein
MGYDSLSGITANTGLAGSVNNVVGVVESSIVKRSGIVRVAQAALFSDEYGFDDQTTSISTSGSGWSPSLTHANWENGAANTTDPNGYWAPPSTPTNAPVTNGKAVGEWRCDYDSTSSTFTGPDGALDMNAGGTGIPTGAQDNSTSSKFIFAETSGQLGGQVFVCRTPGINFAQSMSNTSNDLDITFWLHGYGESIDRLSLWVDDAASSTAVDAILYATFTATHTGGSTTGTTNFSNVAEAHTTVSPTTCSYTGTNSNWVKITVGINALRQINANYYFYFVYEAKSVNGVSYRGDLAIDQVEFVES